MNPDYWQQRWKNKEIGFHEAEGNALLKRFINHWHLGDKPRVFVPLCGKTKDIGWFLSNGIQVVAIELNQEAIELLFEDLGINPVIKQSGQLIRYQAPNLTVFVGDFFALDEAKLGAVDGVYDRGALVAMPPDLRQKYKDHLLLVTKQCSQFLICFDYDQSLFTGPPFSLPKDLVEEYYGALFKVNALYRDRIPGGFREQTEVFEAVYILT